MCVEQLTSPGPAPQAQWLSLPPLPALSAMAFSPLQPRLLAIASGSQVLIHDVGEDKLQQTVWGTGRTVTAVSWSCERSDLLMSGAVDGTLSLWDLQSAASPIARLILGGVCLALACSRADAALFAAIHDGKVSILKRISTSCLRPLRTIALEGDSVTTFSWHPMETAQLLTGTSSGRMCVWDKADCADTSTAQSSGYDSDSSSGEDAFFGHLDGIPGTLKAEIDITTKPPLLDTKWVNGDIFVCLDADGMRCSLWSRNGTALTAMPLWSVQLTAPAVSVSVLRHDGRLVLVAVSSHGISRIIIPPDVVEELQPIHENDSRLCTSTADGSVLSLHPKAASGTMPVAISSLRLSPGSFVKTSKQLQRRRPSFERKRAKTINLESQLDTSKHNPLSPPLPTSLTSSLELPKLREEEGSPMPFISPAIPPRRPSPGELSPLDDSIKLPPLPRASFDSSAQSTSSATQESDNSDDETFVDGMQGSATFLPGGINVPLPKACAALFTPTGELLTFFPPKPKFTPRKGDVHEEKQKDTNAGAKRVARLFPAFGNMVGEPQHPENDSDSGFESDSSMSPHAGPNHLQPSFSFYPSSFPSQQSWKSRISPTKHSFVQQSPRKVIVSLHNLSDVESLLPASRQLAMRYRIVCDPDETGADASYHNAKVCVSLGFEDMASIWRLMALLLAGQMPSEAVSDGREERNILLIARSANAFTPIQARKSLSGSRQHQSQGTIHPTDNPLGSAWIVRAIFDWAEARADIQSLAVLSAVLAQAQENAKLRSSSFGCNPTTLSPSGQDGYFADGGALKQPRRPTNQSIPTLRSTSIPKSSTAYESPVKLKRTPSASSRNQPPTPYSESGLSTPPLSLPSFERQGSHLSISGSASPEHHRSSFSAAAKYYAQSISDKFASYGAYGSSPPARKGGISPSANELSTSFPSGSWGKSVSFASTTNTTRASLLSKSFEDEQEDEGYDSDKTVEDLSQPQTPKESSECLVTLKHDRLFDNDLAGGADSRLLSDGMVSNCRRWCDYYAEQLRCWDLLSQAAELEKVCGMTCLRKQCDDTTDEEAGIMPTIAPNGSRACSICAIKMTGVQFFCSRCSHTAHLDCLEGFVNALNVDGNQDFACPTGCGCHCDGLPFEAAPLEAPREDRPKKKASFTDPRQWRARVEGG